MISIYKYKRYVFIVDAWRACTTKEDFFDRGTIRILLVLDIAFVRDLWSKYLNFKLKGGVVGKKFDLHVVRQCPTQKNYSQVPWFVHEMAL